MSAALARLRAAAARLSADRSGAAAVEFAFVVPLLVTLLLSGVEASAAFIVWRKVDTAAATIGDLVARAETLTEGGLANIAGVADIAVYPADPGPAEVRVTAIDIDEQGAPKVGWSRATGSRPAHAKGAAMTGVLPDDMLAPNTQVVMTESFYRYEPTIGYLLTGPIELAHRTFHVPRAIGRITLCSDDMRVCE